MYNIREFYWRFLRGSTLCNGLGSTITVGRFGMTMEIDSMLCQCLIWPATTKWQTIPRHLAKTIICVSLTLDEDGSQCWLPSFKSGHIRFKITSKVIDVHDFDSIMIKSHKFTKMRWPTLLIPPLFSWGCAHSTGIKSFKGQLRGPVLNWSG